MTSKNSVFRFVLMAFVGLALASIQAKAQSQSICDGIAGNLVTDCGFEGGSSAFTSDWNPSTSNVTASTSGPNSGSYDAQFHNTGGEIDQDLSTAETTADILSGDAMDVTFYINPALADIGGVFQFIWDAGTPDQVLFPGVANGKSVTGCGSALSDGYYACTFTETSDGGDTITFNGNPDPNFNFNYYLDDASVTLAPAAVPEPGTLLMLGSGLIGLAGFARKKLSKS